MNSEYDYLMEHSFIGAVHEVFVCTEKAGLSFLVSLKDVPL